MDKNKKYSSTKFPVDAIQMALKEFDAITTGNKLERYKSKTLRVSHNDCIWTLDTIEEFFADYRQQDGSSRLSLMGSKHHFEHVRYSNGDTEITIELPERHQIEKVFGIFDDKAESAKIPVTAPKEDITIFIGHGNSLQYRDIKDHLHDRHKYRVETYETGNRAGHSIRDILEEMSKKSNFAILVMTAEDQTADGNFRARQNVIHEVGLFQGKLGFSKVIVAVEEGCDVFSNLDGVHQLRYSKNNIKEIYGDVIATIRREFDS